MTISSSLAGLGVKLATAVFGFAGAVVSLAFIKDMTRLQALVSVVVGFVTSVAVTPAIAEWVGLHSGVENGTAFVVGLCAMSVIPAVKAAVTSRIEKLGG